MKNCYQHQQANTLKNCYQHQQANTLKNCIKKTNKQFINGIKNILKDKSKLIIIASGLSLAIEFILMLSFANYIIEDSKGIIAGFAALIIVIIMLIQGLYLFTLIDNCSNEDEL